MPPPEDSQGGRASVLPAHLQDDCTAAVTARGPGHPPARLPRQRGQAFKPGSRSIYTTEEEAPSAPSHWLPSAPCVPGPARTLTLAGVALAEEPHHQGGAVAALSGAGEGLDAELVGSGLWGQEKVTHMGGGSA